MMTLLFTLVLADPITPSKLQDALQVPPRGRRPRSWPRGFVRRSRRGRT